VKRRPVRRGAVRRFVRSGAVRRFVRSGAVRRFVRSGAVRRFVRSGAVRRFVRSGAVRRYRHPLAAAPALGFTLLELLVSTALLLVIVGLLSGLLAHVGDLWNLGTSRTRILARTRAALDFVRADVAGAVVSNIELRACQQTYGATGNVCLRLYRIGAAARADCLPVEIVDYALTNRPDGVFALLRVARRPVAAGAAVAVRPGETQETFVWPGVIDPPIEVVVSSVPLLDGIAAVTFYPPQSDPLQLYEPVDLYLEVLDEAHARRAAAMRDGTAQRRYVNARVIRLAARFAPRTHPDWDPL
jgi:hypothetical protein